MKILIDGQTLRTPEINRGIGKYFLNTVENILSCDFVNEFYIAVAAGTHLEPFSVWGRSKLHVVEHPVNAAGEGDQNGSASRYSDTINAVISKNGIDLYWSPNALMDSVFLPARQVNDCRYAVTIFDLIPLVMEDHFKRAWPPQVLAQYRKKLALLETDYDLFLHISQHTYADFTSRLAVSQKSHVVTPLAVADSFRPYPFPKIVTAENYVLYPGGFDPRKNMNGALEAFAELHRRHGDDPAVSATRLKLVCHIDPASEKDVRTQAKRLGVADKVGLTGFVTDAELIGLYQKARCLFFPSLYEGFGLPVLEGLACGLPIAASNTSSIPEVAGDLALYFDPYDVNDMADALFRALQEPVDPESRLQRYKYSRRFAWQNTGMTTLSAFAGSATESVEVSESMSSEPNQPELIDVRQLKAELSVAELCETAEQFFKRLDNWDYLHAKPLSAINETPDLLIGFAHVVQGLKLLPDMTILDFGAGSCWTSRFLSQMGLKVIAHDVSASALRIGEALYQRWPVIGNQPEPSFLHFNGEQIDLPDASVDRISCWDAFHHVPNQEQVLKEMARILKQGGIAGFSEPGPEHSKSAQSQYEMRTNRVIENDIEIHDIWRMAKLAGFTEMKVAFFSPTPHLLSLEEFETYLNGTDAGENFINETREQMKPRRVFFLFKGISDAPADSRQREGLMSALGVEASDQAFAGEALRVKVVATNTGSNIWLPTTARVGAVHFGVHLFDETGQLLSLDYFRHDLTPGAGRAIHPGETITFEADVPMPPTGKYIMQFDLVSEGICWFEHNGCETVRLKVESRDQPNPIN